MTADPALVHAIEHVAEAIRDLGVGIFWLGVWFLLFKNMGCKHK